MGGLVCGMEGYVLLLSRAWVWCCGGEGWCRRADGVCRGCWVLRGRMVGRGNDEVCVMIARCG